MQRRSHNRAAAYVVDAETAYDSARSLHKALAKPMSCAKAVDLFVKASEALAEGKTQQRNAARAGAPKAWKKRLQALPRELSDLVRAHDAVGRRFVQSCLKGR